MNTELGQELCPRCMTAISAATDFCPHCGAPLTSRATNDPYLSVFAEGFAIRQAVARPNKPIILIGVWLLSISALVGAIASLAGGGGIFGIVAGLGLLALWGAIVYKTTKNYLRMRHPRRNDS